MLSLYTFNFVRLKPPNCVICLLDIKEYKKIKYWVRVPVRFSVVNYSTVFSYYNVFRIMDPDPEG